MKELLKDELFDTKLETSDWRYSASIVGLKKYFDFLEDRGHKAKGTTYKIEDDCLFYNFADITEEWYCAFVEHYFVKQMHHKVVEEILESEELTNEQIKAVNDKLKFNSIAKTIFKNVKFSGDNKQEILDIIAQNRQTLVKETYRNGKALYANFANVNSLLTERNDICRLNNYNIDVGKKSKSLGYNWNFSSFVYEDIQEFDFIPFAFTTTYQSFFINNNYTVSQLCAVNKKVIDIVPNEQASIFTLLTKIVGFIDYDVEVIVKDRSKDYFETVYVRKSAIEILQNIGDTKGLQIKPKVNENYYINLEEEVVNSILNNTVLDSLIEVLLKEKDNRYGYSIRKLIEVNKMIYGGDKDMDDKMKGAYASAKEVLKKIEKNKVVSYRQKLINAIIFKDYEGFCNILLQLTQYSGVPFSFAFDLFADFEKNKNLAYTFVNALTNIEKDGGTKNE